MPNDFYVYVLASASRKLYVGVTGNLAKRVSQHRTPFKPTGYTTMHEIKRLVYCEITSNVRAAISREKQIKGWTRRRKLALIDAFNPEWNDLAEGW